MHYAIESGDCPALSTSKGIGKFLAKWWQKRTHDAIALAAQEELSEAYSRERLLAQESVLSLLCPALQSLANEAMDVAKVSTPVLIKS